MIQRLENIILRMNFEIEIRILELNIVFYITV